MQCGVEKKTIRRQEVIGVECFKYGEREYKYRKCPWQKKKEKKGVERAMHVVIPQEAQ